MIAWLDMRALEGQILRALAPILIGLGSRGPRGPRGARGARGEPAPLPAGAIVADELGSSLARYLAGPVGAAAADASGAWRIRVPAGGRYRVRVAVEGTVPAGETIAAAIYQAASCHGTYSPVEGSQVPIDNFDGGDPEIAGPLVTLDHPWACVGALCTDATPYPGQVHLSLEREE